MACDVIPRPMPHAHFLPNCSRRDAPSSGKDVVDIIREPRSVGMAPAFSATPPILFVLRSQNWSGRGGGAVLVLALEPLLRNPRPLSPKFLDIGALIGFIFGGVLFGAGGFANPPEREAEEGPVYRIEAIDETSDIDRMKAMILEILPLANGTKAKVRLEDGRERIIPLDWLKPLESGPEVPRPDVSAVKEEALPEGREPKRNLIRR